MARITSLSMLLDPEGKDFLAERYGVVIDNIQHRMISSMLKNKDLSGDPTTGSVEAKRFANSESKEYGTARAAAKGDLVKAKPVTVQIDVDREIVEELEEKDTKLYGVEGLIVRRTQNHTLSMSRELERAFFDKAVETGTKFSTSESAAQDILEAAIQSVETTKNNYVDGVPRDMIHVTASPEFYGEIRKYLDSVENSNIDTAAESFNAFHGVRVDSSVYLPAGAKFVVMVYGSIAQPVLPKPYAAEKIGLADAYALELFYYYGTKEVMPDLIQYYGDITPGTLSVASVEGTASGNTKVTVQPSIGSGNSYKYKTGASITAPTYDQSITSGWTVWDGTSDITATTGNKIGIAEVDGSNKCKKYGEATVASKA